MSECVCVPLEVDGHRFVQWIGSYLADCVYTPQDIASFIMAWLNIICWMGALIPQLIKNYRMKTAEALSITFICLWFIGDTTNVIGAYFTGQLQTQIFIGIYYVTQTTLLFSQYVYYQYFRKKCFPSEYKQLDSELANPTDENDEFKATPTKDRGPSTHPSKIQSRLVYILGCGCCMAAMTYSYGGAGSEREGRSHERTILQDSPNLCISDPDISEAEEIIGITSAWISAVIYFTSRLPQVWKNFQRKTTEGLSWWMFCLAITANIFYGMSVLLRTAQFGDDFFIETLPFLIGSMGVLVWDSVIMSQFFYYRKGGKRVAQLEHEEEYIFAHAHTKQQHIQKDKDVKGFANVSGQPINGNAGHATDA